MTPIAWAKLAGIVGVLLFAGWVGRQTMAAENAALRIKHAQTLQSLAEKTSEAAELARQASEKIRAREQEQAQAFAAIGEQYEQDKTHAASEAYDRALACVRSGKCRVRLAASCPTVPGASTAPAGAGQPHAAAEDGGEVAAAAVAIGAGCDAQVRGLQAVLISERTPVP